MVEIRKQAFVGIVGLVSVGLFSVGCGSSSNSTGTAGTTGSTGTAGKAGGTAGTSGSGSAGTTGSGSAGTTGTGGAGGGSACVKAPANGIIADFLGDGGVEIMGGISTYNGVSKPTYTVTSGNLNIMEDAVPASGPQYLGTVIYFNDCVDASAFSGVEFMFGGSFTCPGGSIQYSTNDVQHDDHSTDPKGSCVTSTTMTSCYSPQTNITTVMSNAVMIQEPWITNAGGAPSAPTDPTMLTGLQWQFTIPVAAEGGSTPDCTANINVSAVKFY